MTRAPDLSPEQVVRNAALLDHLIKQLPLKNGAALAKLLQVAPPVISKIRSGALPVGPALILRLLEMDLDWLQLADIRVYIPRQANPKYA